MKILVDWSGLEESDDGETTYLGGYVTLYNQMLGMQQFPVRGNDRNFGHYFSLVHAVEQYMHVRLSAEQHESLIDNPIFEGQDGEISI